jgi:hypothetical protein
MWFRSLIASVSNRTSPLAARKPDRAAARRRTAARRLCVESLEDRRLLCSDVAAARTALAARSWAPVGPATAELAIHPAIAQFASSGARGHNLPRVSAAPLSIAISDVTREEGQSGQLAFVFSVNLSAPSSKVVSVNYATANGSATTSSGDYVGKAGNLTFAPGQTTRTITILVNGDTAAEVDEAFIVQLSRARNASIADAQGLGTILNDDSETGGGGCSPSNPCDPLPPPEE